MNKINVKIFNKGKQTLPIYGSEYSSGFDLKSNFSEKKTTDDFLGNKLYDFDAEKKELKLFQNGGRVLIPTGLHISLPDGYELQIRARSGLALKHGITVSNGVGTIDQDYLGELGVILINTDPNNSFVIKDGDRIGQGILKQVEQVNWIPVNTINELGDTLRGHGGFGHTGISDTK